MVFCGATATAAADRRQRPRGAWSPPEHRAAPGLAASRSGGDPVAGSDSLEAGRRLPGGSGRSIHAPLGRRGHRAGSRAGRAVQVRVHGHQRSASLARERAGALDGERARQTGRRRTLVPDVSEAGFETDVYRAIPRSTERAAARRRAVPESLAEVGPIFEATDNIGVPATVRFTLMQLPIGHGPLLRQQRGRHVLRLLQPRQSEAAGTGSVNFSARRS